MTINKVYLQKIIIKRQYLFIKKKLRDSKSKQKREFIFETNIDKKIINHRMICVSVDTHFLCFITIVFSYYTRKKRGGSPQSDDSKTIWMTEEKNDICTQ